MAYEKQTWKCGDTITADRMNHIEDGIANVDVGYSCSKEWVTLTEESMTTVEESESSASSFFAYSAPITADIIKVTFNSTEYTCSKIADDDITYYGGVSEQEPVFSEYPFAVVSGTSPSGSYNNLITESAGTYQVKIEAYEKTVETSECFDRARGYSCSGGDTVTLADETVTFAAP